MGAFGRSGWPAWKPKKATVDQCQVVSLKRHTFDRARRTPGVLTIEGDGVREEFAVVPTPCHFGGVRWWLVCSCGRRVLALYRPPVRQGFACRHCHRLTYVSNQQEHRFDRVLQAIAADMGPGVTPRDVRAALEGAKGKR